MNLPGGASHRWKTYGWADEAVGVIAAAREIAHTAGRREVSPADLARGILHEENTLAGRLLREHISDRPGRARHRGVGRSRNVSTRRRRTRYWTDESCRGGQDE